MKIEPIQIWLATENEKEKILKMAVNRFLEINLETGASNTKRYVDDILETIKDYYNNSKNSYCIYGENKDGYGFVSIIKDTNKYFLDYGFWSERNALRAMVFAFYAIDFFFSFTKENRIFLLSRPRKNIQKFRRFLKHVGCHPMNPNKQDDLWIWEKEKFKKWFDSVTN